jgi:hypothetical protein
MAGYSGTPLVRKLGIREGDDVGLLGAPDGFGLEDLPAGVRLRRRATGRFDVVVSFHTRRAHVAERLPTLLEVLDPDGGLWIAWPKRASGVATDITEDTVREVALPTGVVDNKVCAVDDTWSGLRLVWRKERRPALRTAGGFLRADLAASSEDRTQKR